MRSMLKTVAVAAILVAAPAGLALAQYQSVARLNAGNSRSASGAPHMAVMR